MSTHQAPRTVTLHLSPPGRKPPASPVKVETPDPYDLSAPGEVTPQTGFDFSIPIIMERDAENVRVVRLRTRLDDAVAARRRRGRPSNRAVRMANAILIEQYLTTGKFGSATEFARRLGVSQPHITGMLNMLNLPPQEIERILFEEV